MREQDVINAADDYIILFGEVKGSDYDCECLSDEMSKDCAIIMVTKLAELEDIYNCNDPMRRSFFWDVLDELKKR